MNEDRKQILISILNGLAISDRSMFQRLQQSILGEATARGMAFSSPTLGTIITKFGELIEERGRKIIEQMRRVFKSTRIDDFTEARQTLRDIFVTHISAMAENATEPIDALRSNFPAWHYPNLMDWVKKTETILLPEIDLLCAELQDQQSVYLSLQPGQVFSGNRALREIFTSARHSLDIIDPYLGSELFDALEVSDSSVQIRILTDPDPKKFKASAKQAAQLFKAQYPRIEIRTANPRDLHDRYVIVDDRTAIHLGASIKDLGKKMTELQKLPIDPIRQQFATLWPSATSAI